MRNLFKVFGVGSAALLTFSSFAWAQAGQTPNPQNLSERVEKLELDKSTGGPAPRHDINGAWAGSANPGLTVRFPVPPMTPLGQKMFSLNKPYRGEDGGREVPVALSNDPLNTCDPQGFPRDLSFEVRGIEFMQGPTAMWQMFQYQQLWRVIWTDERKLPTNVGKPGGPDLRYFGYSVGHWEGDYTFIVDTVGTDDKTWLNIYGDPHSQDMHVQERYTRIDHNTLNVTVTVDDPKIYTKPFVLTKYNMKWIPEQEFEEQLCVPSEMMQYEKLLAVPVGDPNAAKGPSAK